VANAIDVNEANFQEEVLEAGQPVLVDFWAPWCGYCKRLAPILDDLAGDLAGKVKVVKVNVDENRSLAQRHGIMSLPTMVFFTNGEAGEKLIGFMPKDTIKAKLKL